MDHLTNPPKEGLKSVNLYPIGGSEIHPIQRWLGDQGATPVASQETQLMDKQQREASYRLLAAVEKDKGLKEECHLYGNWYQHLYDHLKDKDQD